MHGAVQVLCIIMRMRYIFPAMLITSPSDNSIRNHLLIRCLRSDLKRGSDL
jgi:hypothetical protein